MRTPNDRYGTKSLGPASDGEPVKRGRLPYPTLAERQTRAEKRAAEGAVVMAEHEEREKAKRANMERLKAERLARERE